jgi:hypothetical protein
MRVIGRAEVAERAGQGRERGEGGRVEEGGGGCGGAEGRSCEWDGWTVGEVVGRTCLEGVSGQERCDREIV